MSSALLKEIFDDESLQTLLRDFCEKEISIENYYFLKDIKSLKNAPTEEIKLELAKAIFYRYLFKNGKMTLNINQELIDETTKKFEEMVESNNISQIEKVFDRVVEIVSFVMTDTLSRFVETEAYIEYIKRRDDELEHKAEMPIQKDKKRKISLGAISSNLKKTLVNAISKKDGMNDSKLSSSPTYRIGRNAYGLPLIED